MSIDKFLKKKYDKDSYNCAHLVCDVWEDITGESIRHKLTGFLRPYNERTAEWATFRQLSRLDAPESPCIVLMQRFHTSPHVGIFVRDRVLHIDEIGVKFQPLEVATRYFQRVRFYK